MYLAIMMVASAAIFALFPPLGSADPAIAQERLMDEARWTALALAGTDVGGNGSAAAMLDGGWFDAEAIARIMEALVPEGYGWNATWTMDGSEASAGEGPHGNVGSHAVEIGDGVLLVRLFLS